MKAATFILPGALSQRTGGTIYDAAIIAALRDAGWHIDILELDGRFPGPDETAQTALDNALGAQPDDALVVLDALAGNALPTVMQRHAARLRLVVLVHHPLADETGLGADRAAELLARERRALACADRIVVTSRFTGERLRELGLTERIARVVEPGVTRRPLAHGSSGAACRLLCVGAIVARKGHLVLIDALTQLATTDWRCDVVGDDRRDPDHAERVRRAIADAGLEQRIQMHGALDARALDDCYAQADLFVLASHYEGYGMVITEAIAAGLPIVTTTGGALGATLPAGAGLAVAPDNVPALADALRRMITDPFLRAAAAREAQRARRNLRDWRTAGSEFARALETTQPKASRA